MNVVHMFKEAAFGNGSNFMYMYTRVEFLRIFQGSGKIKPKHS